MKKLTLILLVLVSITSFSQNQQVKVASLENLTSAIPTTYTLVGDTLYNIEFGVNLVDTININKINVKIGSTYNSNDIYEANYYLYDQALSDSTFSREGLRLIGNAGEHFQGVYFYKITVEDFQGVQYTPYIRQQ